MKKKLLLLLIAGFICCNARITWADENTASKLPTTVDITQTFSKALAKESPVETVSSIYYLKDNAAIVIICTSDNGTPICGIVKAPNQEILNDAVRKIHVGNKMLARNLKASKDRSQEERNKLILNLVGGGKL